MLEPGIVAALSPLVGGRVYPLVAPAGSALPRIVYSVVSGSYERSLGGPSGLINSRVQVDVWASGYGEAKSVRAAALAALEAGTGFSIGAVDDVPDRYEDDTKLYAAGADLSVWHAP